MKGSIQSKRIFAGSPRLYRVSGADVASAAHPQVQLPSQANVSCADMIRQASQVASLYRGNLAADDNPAQENTCLTSEGNHAMFVEMASQKLASRHLHGEELAAE